MVVVTGLTAMHHHNPRPRHAGANSTITTTSSNNSHGGDEEGYHHLTKRQQPVNNSSTLIDTGPGCSSSSGSDYEGGSTMEYSKPEPAPSHNHNQDHPFYSLSGNQHQTTRSQEPGFFYNGEQHSSDHFQEMAHNNTISKNTRRTSLEQFFSSPMSTPSPSSSPSSSPRKSASFTSKSSNSFINKNGFVNHHSGHFVDTPKSLGSHKNGLKDNSKDYVLLSQYNSDPRHNSRENDIPLSGTDLYVSPTNSPTREDASFLAQYSDSSLIDAGEHHTKSRGSFFQQTIPETTKPAASQAPPSYEGLSQQPSSGRRKPPKLSGAGPLFHNGKNGNSFGDSTQSSSASRLGYSRNSVASMSLDSPFVSMSRLDTWGPSYVTASFFMSSGTAADPIHHPVPRRGTHDSVRRSHSSSLFANVSAPHRGPSETSRRNSNTMSGTVGGSGSVTSAAPPPPPSSSSSSSSSKLVHHQPQQHRPRSSSNDMFTAATAKHLSRAQNQHQSPMASGNRLHSSTRDLSSITRDAASLVAGKYDTNSLRSVKMVQISKEEDSVSVKSLNVTHSSSFRPAPSPGRDTNVISRETHVTIPQVSSHYSTLPRKGSHGQFLRRSLSHDPRAGEVTVKTAHVVARTASDGEIESEYVTLDRMYIPSSTSRLCRVIEDISSTPPSNPVPSSITFPLTQSSSSKGSGHVTNLSSLKHANHSRSKASHRSDSSESNGDASPTSILKPTNPSANLVKSNTSPNSSMHSGQFIKTNSEDRKSQSGRKKSGPGPLRAMAETLGSVFSNSSSPSRQSSGETPLSPFDLSSPISPTSPLALSSTNYSSSTMQRSGSSRAKDSNPSQQPQGGRMTRSKSLPDLQKDATEDSSAKNYSDDEDGDEFGFLSYPISFSSSCASTVMNKAKSSPSAGARIFPKRWRSKSKAVPTGAPDPAAMWTPGPPGSCTWSSVSGRKVTLRPVSILQLTDSERLALQKIAHSKLQDMELGCPVVIPKDSNEVRRSKKSSLSLKRRSKSVNASAIDSAGKDGAALGLVFGIPLSKCVLNDRELEKKRRRVVAHSGTSGAEQVAGGASSPPSSSKMRAENSENIDPAQNSTRPARKSSSSSQGSLENSGGMTSYRHDALAIPAQKRAVSSDSLSESESSRNTSSSLIDALTLSHQSHHPAFRPGSLSMDARELANQGLAQVPYVVKACFRHIEAYGLNTLGIFRVGSSKKRVKQLREEFDSGQEVQLTEDHNPHDVGALLKEYYRDLPEPLLTTDLYLPFLCAKRLTEEHQRHNALRLLICMLPLANRDTLWSLLRFLAKVAQHAQDTIDEKGETVSGNKMDVHNLATLFGPNILRRSQAGGVASASDKELMYQQSGDRVEESKEVIEVVKDMIDNHHDLFELSGSLRDDVLRLLIESDQETADRVLKYLANQNQIDADPESMCSVFEESATNSPLLFHRTLRAGAGTNVAVDGGNNATTSHHRPLRVSRSADNSLDSPVSKSRATHLSDSQAMTGPGRESRAAAHPHSQSLSYSPSQHSQHYLEPQLTPPSSLTPPLSGTSGQNFETSSHHYHHHHPHHHHHHHNHHHHHQHQVSGFPNPLPELRVHPSDSPLSSIGSTAAALAGATGAVVVLRGKPQTLQVSAASGLPSRPHSEGYHLNLNIPRPVYMREDSAASSYGSSGSGDALSSSLNSHLSSDNTATNTSNKLTETWGLPTPPTSRGSSPSPKAAFFSSTSSSSTLIPASSSPHLNNNSDYDENQPPLGSAEWERERWKHWEKVAAEKSRKNAEAEQETLV